MINGIYPTRGPGSSNYMSLCSKASYAMATDSASRYSGVDAFFERCGLPPDTRHRCWAFIRESFPGRTIKEVRSQGYCSYTLCVEQDTIVQFRPPVHKLDIRLAKAARDVYGSRAPWTETLGILTHPQCSSKHPQDGTDGRTPIDEAISIDDDEHEPAASLHVYSFVRLPGTPLAEVLALSRRSPMPSLCQLRQQQETIVEQFAEFIATGWKSALPAGDPIVSSLRGRVGGTIRWRLEQMEAHLPQRFQPAVRATLDRLDEIESLPWALTHGDISPANVMVRPPRGRPGVLVVTGFLDWAEAEYLPLGVGSYGLETFLGEAGVDDHFAYYVGAEDLRALFWSRLAAELPGLSFQAGTPFREVAEAAHVLGVLLWHGIAFDNGRLDRVVEEGKDDEEIWSLDVFFRSHDDGCRSRR